MRTILVPTDFSLVAANAYQFAQELAQREGAELRVVHIYHPTVDAANPYLNIPTPDLADLKEKYLRQFIEKYQVVTPEGTPLLEQPVRQDLQIGIPVDELLRLSREADLMVMGTKGENNVLRRLFGSVCTQVARRANCPVWLIPPEGRWSEIKQVLFATDYDERDEALLRRMLQQPHIRDAHQIHLVHLMRSDSDHYQVADVRLEPVFSEADQAIDLVKAHVTCADLWQGLQEYAEDHQIDLMVMGTDRRSFLDQLFHRSFTKEMILKAKVPLLIQVFTETKPA